MIERLFRHPYVLHQKAERDDIASPPIAGHIDAGELIIISQEGRDICIDHRSVTELCKMLRLLAKHRDADKVKTGKVKP